MKNPIRKIFNLIGLDIHRYHKKVSKVDILRSFSIKTVLDIGANVGQFAKEIREVLPLTQIYSFEPIKSCFQELNQKFESDQKFKSFNFALGEEEKEAEIQKSAYTPSSSILQMAKVHKDLFPHTSAHNTEKIIIKKLDEVVKDLDLKKEILIKVDVQGFEDKVILGGQNTFKDAKVVLIENSFVELYEGQPLFDDIYSKLKSLGFIYKGALQEKVNNKTGEIISEDSLFIK